MSSGSSTLLFGYTLRGIMSHNAEDASAEFPTYGRQSSITGFIALEDRETVSEIVLKASFAQRIKGKMHLMISEGSSRTTKVVNDSYTLWSSQKSHPSPCPGAIPFSVTLPPNFQDDNHISYPLPPSYEVPYNAVLGFFFKSSYSLSVTITRMRTSKFQFLSQHKTLSVRLIYSPRLRPSRPIQHLSDFFSDIKTMPDEWRQVASEMRPRDNFAAQPVDLHLFLPMVDVFGLADTIPFHVQITGSTGSLREFLPEPRHTSSSRNSTVVGTLVRQIVVEVNGRHAMRNMVIGHAKLASRPPGAAANAHEASLDWDGELRCKAGTTVGMFDTGTFRIQDFILVEIRPPNAQKSQFSTLRLSHPVKLVTDSWLD
ncbi:hypothetical protein FB451DRAFT_1461135 [Mycena latifolia]|nr:hypothetical protein FB451DRAFT_1461135 [Mycena latifolia]